MYEQSPPILYNAMKIPFERISPTKHAGIVSRLVFDIQCNRVYIKGIHKSSAQQPQVGVRDYVLYNDLYRLATTSAFHSFIVQKAVSVYSQVRSPIIKKIIQNAILGLPSTF